ncbi:MAG: hypothetical protein WCJ95_17460 [Mariniphaga sp.]
MKARPERSAGTNTQVPPKEKSALKALNQLAYDAMRFRYPLIRPELLPPSKFSDKTANKLTSCIITWIRYNGGQAERINVTGRQIDQRKIVMDCLGNQRQIGSLKWITGNGTRGSADISATIAGKSVKIEVKIGRDRQRPDQVEYQRSVEAAGGIYIIATSFQQFYDWYVKTF